MDEEDKIWELKSGVKRFKWTGKLITFKTKNIAASIRRHFKSTNGKTYNELAEELPKIFLVLGYQTTRSSRTGIVAGNVLLLGGNKTIKFHLAPQFCTNEDVVVAFLETFFVDAIKKESNVKNI